MIDWLLFSLSLLLLSLAIFYIPSPLLPPFAGFYILLLHSRLHPLLFISFIPLHCCSISLISYSLLLLAFSHYCISLWLPRVHSFLALFFHYLTSRALPSLPVLHRAFGRVSKADRERHSDALTFPTRPAITRMRFPFFLFFPSLFLGFFP